MTAQRLLPYDEINSDYILMLDDDIDLQPDSIEKLITTADIHHTDLLGVDTFHNHKLPLPLKIKAAITNLVFPHFSQEWAFKISNNGSFSYIHNPQNSFYPSQSCAGNIMLWRKSSYKKLLLEDEKWMDSLPYAYSDDMVESYKVFKNDMKLGIVYNCGVKHSDCKSSSAPYRKCRDFIKNRTIAQFTIWWRTCFNPGNSNSLKKILASISFSLKMLWLFLLFLFLSIAKLNFSYISNFLKGISEGWKFVRSEPFKSLPPYVIR